MEYGGLGFSGGPAGTSTGPIRGNFEYDTRLHRAGPYTPDPRRQHQRTDSNRSFRDIVEAASVKATAASVKATSSVVALLQPLLVSSKNAAARVLAGASAKIRLTEGPPRDPKQHLHNTGYSNRLPNTQPLLPSQQEQPGSPDMPSNARTGADGHAANAVILQMPDRSTAFPAGSPDLSKSNGEEIGHAFVVPAPRRVAGAGALRAAVPSLVGKSRPVGHPVFRSIDGSREDRSCGGASHHASARHTDMPTLQQGSVRPKELSSMRDDIIGPLDAVLDAYLGGMRCQVDELERGARKRRRVLEESIQAKLVQQPTPLPRRLLATRFPAIAPGQAPKPAVDSWHSRIESLSNEGLELRDIADATSSASAQQAVADKSMPEQAFLGKEENQCHAKETTDSVCKTDANESTQTALLSLPKRKDIAAIHQQEDAGTVVATIVRDSANPMSRASAVAQGTPTHEKADSTAEVVKVETREDFWRVQIEAIYRRRNPHKLAEVPQLLAKNCGQEASLYCKICRRYDLNPKLLYADPKSWEAEDKDVKDDDDDNANCHAGSLPGEVNTAMTVNSSVSAPSGGRADHGVSLFGRPEGTSGSIPEGSSLFGGTSMGIGSTQNLSLSSGFPFGGSKVTGSSDASQSREDALPASSTSGTSIFGATPSGASSAFGTSIFGVAPSTSSAINSSASGLAFPGSGSTEASNAVASIFGAGNSTFNFGSSSGSSSSSIFREGLQGTGSTVGESSDSAKSIFASVAAPGDRTADKHAPGIAQEDGERPPPSISSLFGSAPPEKHGLNNIFGAPPKAGSIFGNQSNVAAPSFGLPATPSQPIAKRELENGDDNEGPRGKADKEVMAKRRIVRAKRSRPATAEAVPTDSGGFGLPAPVQSVPPPQPALELTGTVPSMFAASAEAAVAATDGGTSAAGGSLFAGMAAAGRADSAANCEDKQLQETPASVKEQPGGDEQNSEGEKPVAIESKYDFWKVQIEAIYRRRNPHKMKEVTQLMEKYKDKEMVLYRKVCLRYDLDSKKLYADPAAWESEEKDVKDDDDGEATGTADTGTSGSGAGLFGTGTGNIFGSQSSGGSLFGGSSTGSLFGGSSTGSLFGGPSTGSSSLFSSQAQSTSGSSSGSSSSSLFGGANSGASLFGGAGAAGATSGGIFGGAGVAGATSGGIFGGAGAAGGTSGGIFGGAGVAGGSSGGIFGGAGAAGGTSGGIFGGAGAAGSSSSSIFGGTGAAGSTSGGIFGGVGAVGGTSGSMFGGGTNIFGGTSSSNNIFGAAATKSSNSGLSIFGGVSQGQGAGETSTMGTASSGGLFGSSSSSSGGGGLLGSGVSFSFGAAPSNSGSSGSTGSSLFSFGAGAPATAASSASFGVGGFGATANNATSGSSGLFGAPSGESNLFGIGGFADEGTSKRKRRMA